MSAVTDLRQDAVARLVAAGITAHDSRQPPLEDDALPCVVVSTPRSRRESKGGGPPTHRHTCWLELSCLVKDTADADCAEALDDLEDDALTALFADAAWPALYESVADVDSQRGRGAEGEYRYAAALLTIEVRWTDIYEPAAASLVDFSGADVEVDLGDPPDAGGPDGTVDATTDWDVPT